MKTERKQVYRCCLKILSPVHLGSDDVYEPMGFVVDEQRGRLVTFDPITFIADLPAEDKQKFSEICKKGTFASILEIYKFLKGRQADGKPVEVCKGFLDHYRKTLSMRTSNKKQIQQELNRFTIARTAFQTVDQRPYIPGSAVKGALRTACLNQRQKLKKAPKQHGEKANKLLEKILLDGGSFTTDPFRMVKVSDFRPVGHVSTKVMYAINRKKKLSKFEASGPYQILEVVLHGAWFIGEITVDRPGMGSGIRNPFELEAMLKMLDWFYRKEKDREDRELAAIGTPAVAIGDNSGQLIRIGRHSGAECLTIEGHRHIRIAKGKGKPEFKDHATTLWLAANNAKNGANQFLAPFGWALLLQRTDRLEQSLLEEEAQWQSNNSDREKKVTESIAPEPILDTQPVVTPEVLSPLEKPLKRLGVIKPNDMGSIGTIIQEIETLESDVDKGALAKAIKDKISKKVYKKYKKKAYLDQLIQNAGLE